MSPRKTAHGLERATHRVRQAWGNARTAVGHLDMLTDPLWRRGYADGLRRALDILIEEQQRQGPDDTRNGPTHAEQSLPPG
jgi:hypothetical protein